MVSNLSVRYFSYHNPGIHDGGGPAAAIPGHSVALYLLAAF
jgi:hypothetical protein